MLIAIVLTIVATFIWAVTSHIDKYILCNIVNYNDSLKIVLIFSSFVAGIIFAPIWLIKLNFDVFIDFYMLIIVFFSTIFYLLSLYFYFKALEKNDASLISAMFQLVPIFSYIISRIFFKDILTINELIGAIIIMLSAIIISYDFDNYKNKNKSIALIYMFFSCLFEALYYFTFEVSMRYSNFLLSSFWYQTFLLLIGIFLLFRKKYYVKFFKNLKNSGKKYIKLNIVNEFLNMLANFMINFANITIPIAIANTLNGLQSVFVFIIGIIGTLLFPKYIKEDISGNILLQKIICFLISIIGIFIMFY